MDKNVPLFILPPTRKSTGRGEPVLLRAIASPLVTRPLNRRLHNYLERLRDSFPDDPIVGSFKIEQSGPDLHFQFSVNGDTEDFILHDWRQLHNDESLARLRVLPWKLFEQIFNRLDEPFARLIDNDLMVQVYPNRMRPTPKGNYDFTYFPAFYTLLLPVWQHGKDVYKSNRNYPNWRQTVRQEIEGRLQQYPVSDLIEKDLRLDGPLLDCLVARFQKPLSHDDLTALQAEVKDRRIPATAEELALDHAAHVCGVSLYEYTVRYLKTLKAPNTGRRAKRIDSTLVSFRIDREIEAIEEVRDPDDELTEDDYERGDWE